MRILTLLIIIVLLSSCGKTEQKQAVKKEDTVKQEYHAKGEEVTNLAQAELLKNVSRAMKKGGPEYAIDFCNIRALPLLDSVSRVNNCQIRRIAIKFRNPEDKPQSEMERKQLDQYLNEHKKGSLLESKIFVLEDSIEFYKPIFLGMDACLKCHGTPGTQIAEETLKKIKEHYPEDLATGFELNDFRGAWKVTFNKVNGKNY